MSPARPLLLLASLLALSGCDPLTAPILDDDDDDSFLGDDDDDGAVAWSVDWIAFEEEVLEHTNNVRANGADCDTEGVWARRPRSAARPPSPGPRVPTPSTWRGTTP